MSRSYFFYKQHKNIFTQVVKIIFLCAVICINLNIGVAQGRRPLVTSFTSTQQSKLAELIKNYLDTNIPYLKEHNEPDDCTDPTCIHVTSNFLRWHRYYIERMEDYIYSQGYPEFVPLPKWDPMTIIPDAFFSGQYAKANNYYNDEENRTIQFCNLFRKNPQIDFLNLMGRNFPGPDDDNNKPICGDGSYDTFEELTDAIGPLNNSHGSVHVVVQGNGNGNNPCLDLLRAVGSTWFYIWHAYVDDIWFEWERCHNSTIMSGADLYMKDQSNPYPVVSNDQIFPQFPRMTMDHGEEPNLVMETWRSPDIWVRKQNDGITNTISENPEYRDPGFGIKN